MPATSAVFLVGSIGTRVVAVVRTVVDMSFSFGGLMSYRGWVVGTSGWLGSTWVTETSGRPTSRTFWSRPCSAAWSATGPWMRVVPSLSLVRLSPSNQAALHG